MVQVQPTRSIVPQGGPHSLRCQVSGSPPHYFYWSREDGRPLPSSTQQRHQGTHGPNPMSHPVGGEAQACPCPAGVLSLRRVGWWEQGCICTDELPSALHQALSSTSPASSPRMLESTFAPVVISIMPTPAGQNCWSLVSPCFRRLQNCLPWAGLHLQPRQLVHSLPEGMVVAWMRPLAREMERGDGVKTGLRAEVVGLDCGHRERETSRMMPSIWFRAAGKLGCHLLR